MAFDATLVELNPFVLLTNGAVMALDAKVTIDDNALFRQPDDRRARRLVPGRSGREAREGRRACST